MYKCTVTNLGVLCDLLQGDIVQVRPPLLPGPHLPAQQTVHQVAGLAPDQRPGLDNNIVVPIEFTGVQ